jgi:septation ring formation regulator EzrA
MRFLVAVTCLAVLAAVGLYFYRDQQASQATAATEKERALRNTCLSDNINRLPQVKELCYERGYLRR